LPLQQLAIGFYNFKKKSAHHLICALVLIFSGALGNIIDSVFYGIIFDDSLGQKASLFLRKPLQFSFLWKSC